MSADNWAVCPRCLHEAERAAAEARDVVMALYGTIPVAEFDAKRAALEDVDPEVYTTFREDYEFHGAEDGEVVASYSGTCTTCGLSADLRHSERFWSAP